MVTAWRVLVILTLWLAGLCCSEAARLALSPACMVSESELILVGSIEGISAEPILQDEFGSVHLATVGVLVELKGQVLLDGKESELLYLATRLGLTEQARLELGKKYLLYINQSEAGPHVLNGGQGAIEISEREIVGLRNIMHASVVRETADRIARGEGCSQ